MTLLSRRILLVILVAATWIAAARWLGSRSEAFWLLFPLWVLAGAFILRAIPVPRAQHKSPLANWSLRIVVILVPISYCYGMAYFMGASVNWREVLIAVWFFAASLEILLLYLFQVFDGLRLRLAKGRGRVGGMAALVGTKLLLYVLLIPFLLATLSLHRVKFASRVPPPELGMNFEEVRFPSRGEPRMNLAGWFFPLKNNKGTVLACHGVGANRADILQIVWMLQDAGFQVLCFDFRGHGESDGHTISYGYRERQDVLGAWDYLATRHDVDPNKIFGFGLSMGGSSLLMALPDMPGMKAVVADSAFSSLDLMVRQQFRFVPGSAKEIPVAFARMVGWLDSDLRVDQADTVAAIRGLKVPIFFIHGLDDATIPPECARILFDGYCGPKKLRLEPGAGHGETALLNMQRYEQEVREFYSASVPDYSDPIKTYQTFLEAIKRDDLAAAKACCAIPDNNKSGALDVLVGMWVTFHRFNNVALLKFKDDVGPYLTDDGTEKKDSPYLRTDCTDQALDRTISRLSGSKFKIEGDKAKLTIQWEKNDGYPNPAFFYSNDDQSFRKIDGQWKLDFGPSDDSEKPEDLFKPGSWECAFRDGMNLTNAVIEEIESGKLKTWKQVIQQLEERGEVLARKWAEDHEAEEHHDPEIKPARKAPRPKKGE